MTKMKLSDAIRAGAKMKPQGFGRMYPFVVDPKTGAVAQTSCALGAAFDAIGGNYVLGPDGPWFEMLSVRLFCPVHECDGSPGAMSVIYVIAHLNDHHRWSREQIADWIDECAYPSVEESVCAESLIP